MLYKVTPFTGFTAALASGILTGDAIYVPAVFFAVCILLALFILFHTIFFKGRGNSLIYGLTLHVFIFFTGAALTMLKKNDRMDQGYGIRHMQIRIDDYPGTATSSMKIPSTVLTIEGREIQKSGRIILYTGIEFIPKNIKPGNIAAVNTRLRLIEDFNANDGFDYAGYMRRKGYYYYAFCSDRLRLEGDSPLLRHIGLRIRQQLGNMLEENIGDSLALSVVTAMILGKRELVEEDTREAFRRSGIMHIMAVSGLHVGIIALFISLLLRLGFIRSRTLKLVISLFFIWLFALITGLSPSVTRASLMFSFLGAGYLFYRPATPLNSVMASAFILLLINPLSLFQPSFILSYSAVIFIVSFYHRLSSKLRFRGRLLRWIWKMIVVSLLAQAGTAAFVALFFNEIPVLALFSNLFAIPLAMLIVFTGIVLLAFSWFPLIANAASSLLGALINTLYGNAALVSSFEMATVHTGNISAPRAILVFALLLSVFALVLGKAPRRPHTFLIILILYIIIP